MAKKAAETKEAVAQEIAENVSEEVAEAETEIVPVKVAETKEVVKRWAHPFLILSMVKHRRFANEYTRSITVKMGLKKLIWAKICLNLSKLA